MSTNIMLSILAAVFVILMALAVAFGWFFYLLYVACLVVGYIVSLVRRVWAILREEVLRPLRVIRKALSRKREILLDEYERHLS